MYDRCPILCISACLCHYVLMRTSIDLPDELLREAKIAAVNRGVTLRELVTDALHHELHGTTAPSQPLRTLDFPLIRSGVPGSLRITAEDIRRLEEEDDLRVMGQLP